MKNLFLCSLLFAIPLVYAAEDDHREHAAHQHGHAKMNLAWSGDELNIELISPAYNLIGFEHKAESSADKKTLQKAVQQLKKPLQLITPNIDAACTLESLSINSALLDEEHHEHEEHKDHDNHEAHKEHEDHDHEEHEEHEEHETSEHADFEISIAYHCKKANRLNSVETKQLFKVFNGLEELDVQWISAQKQAATELTPSNTLIKLQ